MAPQFVDLNSDGHLDVVTGTFDGSPHVAYGSKEGFAEPAHVLDKHGRRILLGQFWNYDTGEWDEHDEWSGHHATSAVAHDWEGDGDLDLILGDYGKGKLFLHLNEGKAGAPAFAGKSTPIEAGGKPFTTSKVSSPLLVDWDADGRMDLLVGSFGHDTWQWSESGGSVVWLRNVGADGATVYAAPVTLIEPSRTRAGAAPMRPDVGLYVDATDYDADGDLDLLVGGYSFWDPPKPALDAAQTARADALQAQIERDSEAQSEMLGRALEDAEGEEAVQAAYRELTESEAYQKLSQALEEARAELELLRPSSKREAAIWLYRRIG